MSVVIFACVHNAGRSQMAAAFFNQLADPAKARAVSAGTNPAQHIHPVVIDAMNELGLDLSAAKPRRLTDDLARNAALLVTMGCGETCPVIPGLERQDWGLRDPKDLPIETVRVIRTEIRARVTHLVSERGWGVD